MRRVDLMVDIETIGTKPNQPMIQLGAVAFDIETGAILDELNIGIAVGEDVAISGDTLRWWLKTDHDLFKELVLSGGLSEREAIMKFNSWVTGLAWKYLAVPAKGVPNNPIAMIEGSVDKTKVFLWGNGILFDNRIIKGKCEQYGLEYPISYKSDRDMRTISELYCEKYRVTEPELRAKFKPAHAHDALADCKAQCALVSFCYNELMK